MFSAEQKVMQEVLRNPQNYGVATVSEMTSKASSELERLWRMEWSLRHEVGALNSILTHSA
jgi:hypothetical protein